jgi:glycosyltransferase involved in cell wall biosynthesis
VDGHTPNGGLGLLAKEALIGYDRILGYTKYGAHVLAKVIGQPPGCVPYLPHGLDPIWFPRDKPLSRKLLGVEAEDFVVGVVATNQKRKDWGLAATIGRALSRVYGSRYRQWWHTDLEEKEWSIPALLNEFDLAKQTIVTFPPRSDEWMACAYSACDVTLGIGSEGFGFPLAESQLCGTPTVHMDYAGGAELVPPANRVGCSTGYWLDGLTNIMRPVFPAEPWVVRATEAAQARVVADLRHLYWDAVWPRWAEWFQEGAS